LYGEIKRKAPVRFSQKRCSNLASAMMWLDNDAKLASGNEWPNVARVAVKDPANDPVVIAVEEVVAKRATNSRA